MSKNHKPKTVLVVAAHPDDEVLGCGATIARHHRNGDQIHILILAEGISNRHAPGRLHQAAHQSAKILGASSLFLQQFPDNRMDSLDLLDIVKVVEEHMDHHRPDVVYTHHGGDLNIDHQLTHQAVITACRPQPGHCVKTMLFFEVPSSTEWQPSKSVAAFTPDWFVDVASTWPIKIKALKAYALEMKPWPHPRSLKSVEHLARWRGSTAGYAAAEAFILGRHRE